MFELVRKLLDSLTPWQPISPMATPAAQELKIHLDADANAEVTLLYDQSVNGITITGQAKGGAANGQMLSNVMGIAALAITSEGNQVVNKFMAHQRDDGIDMGGPKRPRPRPRVQNRTTSEGGATSMAGGGKSLLSIHIGPDNPRDTITSGEPKLKLEVRISSPTTVRIQRT